MENKMNYKKKDELLFAEVERMINGDFSGFDRMYELSAKYIYKIINDVVKNHHATEDLMQDTYISIYNNIGSLQNPRGFYSWAGRIATNNALMYIRKNKKELLVGSDEDGESEDFIFERASEDHEEYIPETIVMNEESQKIIAKILDDLPVEQKITVQYYYFEEMSVQEIADAMECSTGTVKSRLNYARKTIKAAIEELDKKYGTKLYAMGVGPVITFVFEQSVEKVVLTAAMISAGVASITAKLGVSAGAGAAAGLTGAAGAAGAAGGVGATVGLTGAAVAKVAAVIAALAVVTTGTVVAINVINKKDDKKPSRSHRSEKKYEEEEETTQAETSMVLIEETVEETVETEPEIVELSFFEEQGFSNYSSTSFSIPGRLSFGILDEEGNIVDSVAQTENRYFDDAVIGDYYITNISKSAPDANGNVVITVDYEIVMENTVNVVDDDVYTAIYTSVPISYDFNNPCVFDYYTGQCLSCSKSKGGEVAIGDDTYDISVDLSGSHSSDWGTWIVSGGTFAYCDFTFVETYTLTIVCPADYDGLVVVFNQNFGHDDDSSSGGESSGEDGSHIFTMSNSTGSDYCAFRLSEYC
ncbi:MAG: sigma-70 family RNA polymerase sigma factor [Saccharofermentans sp.]|nr:sigma-70 family RNA polymerase sigma factor [Saccharofermentans sp.]